MITFNEYVEFAQDPSNIGVSIFQKTTEVTQDGQIPVIYKLTLQANGTIEMIKVSSGVIQDVLKRVQEDISLLQNDLDTVRSLEDEEEEETPVVEVLPISQE